MSPADLADRYRRFLARCEAAVVLDGANLNINSDMVFGAWMLAEACAAELGDEDTPSRWKERVERAVSWTETLTGNARRKAS